MTTPSRPTMGLTGVPGSGPIHDSITYFDSKEAAGFMGHAENTLRRWRSEGRGPAYVKPSSRVFYRKDVLVEYMEKSLVQTG